MADVAGLNIGATMDMSAASSFVQMLEDIFTEALKMADARVGGQDMHERGQKKLTYPLKKYGMVGEGNVPQFYKWGLLFRRSMYSPVHESSALAVLPKLPLDPAKWERADPYGGVYALSASCIPVGKELRLSVQRTSGVHGYSFLEQREIYPLVDFIDHKVCQMTEGYPTVLPLEQAVA